MNSKERERLRVYSIEKIQRVAEDFLLEKRNYSECYKIQIEGACVFLLHALEEIEIEKIKSKAARLPAGDLAARPLPFPETSDCKKK